MNKSEKDPKPLVNPANYEEANLNIDPENYKLETIEQPPKLSKLTKLKRLFKKPKLLISFIIAILLIVSIFLQPWKTSQDNIIIGDITITKKDVTDYAKNLDKYKTDNPQVDFGGESKAVALNDLVLNAALKNEAKLNGVKVTDKDFDNYLNRGFKDARDGSAIKAQPLPAGYGNLLTIRNENEYYKERLEDKLLSSKQLLIANIGYNTPFYAKFSPDKQRELHQQATQRLGNDFLPLFKEHKSKEEIASKADVNGINSDRSDDSDYKQYETGLVSSVLLAAYIPNQTFNDVDDVENKLNVKIDNLHDTDEKVSKLKNVGDYTEVFASKAGWHMIARLEAKSSGSYDSYEHLLEIYKDKYTKNFVARILPKILNTSFGQAVKLLDAATAAITPKAEAAVFPNCASHNVTFHVYAWNPIARVIVRGGNFHYNHSNGNSCQNRYNGYSNLPIKFIDNCFGPAPRWNFGNTNPPGHTFNGVVTSSGPFGYYFGWPLWIANYINSLGTINVGIHAIPNPPLEPPPPLPLTCGNVTLSPSPPEPSEDFTVTVNVNYSGAPPPSRPNQTMNINVGGFYTNANAAYTNNGSASTFTTPNLNQPAAGQYNITWSLSGGGVSSGSCSGTVTIMPKPYLRVYGGDVLAGSGFGVACVPPSDAKIIAFNKGNGIGAGTQFAAQSVSAITEFTSALGRTSAPQPNKGLSFANTGSGFGGDFGAGLCAKDYFAAANVSPGNQTIGATNIGNGQHNVTYVDGNAIITGNIIYTGSGSWGNLDEIPSYYLIVRGNIYIDSSVTRLDGVFIAQPNTANPTTTGRIYTCANGSNQVVATSLYTTCNNKLTINGAFVAKQVKFLRTKGVLKNSSNTETSSSANIAEAFVYSPELWLINPGLTPLNPAEYDSITSLPPVL